MAEITNQPNGIIVSAYCPIGFNVKTDNLGGTGIQYEVFVNGQSKEIFCTDCRFIQDGEQLVYFSIDVSGVVRDCLGCNFHALTNSGSVFDNPDTYLELQVEFKDIYEDADGCVKINEDTAVMSSTVIVTNSKIQKNNLPRQAPESNNYNFDAPVDWIHTNKRKVSICWNQDEFLTVMPVSQTGGYVTAYDGDGNSIFNSPLAFPALQATSYNVGPAALGLPLNACSYKIVFFGGEATEKLVYKIEKKCCTEVRIHFKNCFGKQDSFNFEKAEKINDTTSKIFKKGEFREWKRINDINTIRYNITKQDTWRLSFCNPTSCELKWLKELQETEMAFIEVETKEPYQQKQKHYCQVRVLDGTQSYYKTNRNSSDFEYSIEIEIL